MKLYGYAQGSEEESPLRLKEATIAADAPTLRLLAQFLLHVADEIEIHGDDFGHSHFCDVICTAPEKPQFVVTGPVHVAQKPLIEYVDISVRGDEGRRFAAIVTGPLEYWVLFAERLHYVRVYDDEVGALREEPATANTATLPTKWFRLRDFVDVAFTKDIEKHTFTAVLEGNAEFRSLVLAKLRACMVDDDTVLGLVKEALRSLHEI